MEKTAVSEPQSAGLGWVTWMIVGFAVAGAGLLAWGANDAFTPEKIQYVNDTRIVERPVIVEKEVIIEKPVIQIVEKIIEKPVIIQNYTIIEVPKYIYVEKEPEHEPDPVPSNDTASNQIKVYAKRVPSEHWGDTFTGAGAQMFVALYKSDGSLYSAEFFDENGATFTVPDNSTYLAYPADCEGCHGSDHDVVFKEWENGSIDRPRAVASGQEITAYYEYNANDIG